MEGESYEDFMGEFNLLIGFDAEKKFHKVIAIGSPASEAYVANISKFIDDLNSGKASFDNTDGWAESGATNSRYTYQAAYLEAKADLDLEA